MEEWHQGSAAQDICHNEPQSQGFRQQEPKNPYNQQHGAEQLNASPCMSKFLFVMALILMRLEQGQNISKGALPRPWSPFAANRLFIAVGPDFPSLQNQAYLEST